MKLQEIITKDEQDRVVRNKFYISNDKSDVSHTISYKYAREQLTYSGLIMGFDCSDYEWNNYQKYKIRSY